jgi:hypothetical protein
MNSPANSYQQMPMWSNHIWSRPAGPSSKTFEHVALPTEVAFLFEEIRRAVDRNPNAAHAAALRVMTVLTESAAPQSAVIRGGLAPWQQRKIDRYLKGHLELPLRQERLADQVPFSVSHFCRPSKDSVPSITTARRL